jgi:N-acetylglucosaminyldiphosphoundecaprenol N-acetyl-beta-D-mannosaminyltransferase
MGDAAKVHILGSPVSAIDMPAAISWLSERISRRAGAFVCVADVHSIMRARTDPGHAKALATADLVTPDGTPLVWIARLRDVPQISRVCGPDLMSAACEESLKTAWRHYFYGGAEGVSERLAEALQRRYRGLQVVGTATPPFRALTPAEDEAEVQAICEARPDIVWVGLGCPKQEAWMASHAKRLPGAILIGVGAAFNFHTGDIKRAPRWMRNNGLEWLHRFASEPRRLWRRYLQLAPRFLVLALMETWLKLDLARAPSQ